MSTLTLCAGCLICGLAGVNIEIGPTWLKGMVWTFIEVPGVHREPMVAFGAERIVGFDHGCILALALAHRLARLRRSASRV